MNKTFAISLVVIGVVVISSLLFGVGMMFGRSNLGLAGNGSYGMMGVGNNNPAYSMMGNGYNMMGGYRPAISANVKPLTVDQATQAVNSYLQVQKNPDLELKEIMIFDNGAYARITEKSTGIGAMEFLIDPVSLSVYPEYGPNMMWNLKYGSMSSGGMMGRNGGGMMGGYSGGMMGKNATNSNPVSVSASMTVSSEQAVKIAQDYLDQQFPGYQPATDPDPFYGYYTIDILKDGKPTGMLSVNGFNGQVFLHTWHGTFIEMSE